MTMIVRLIAVALLVGCTPSPVDVCAHWATLGKAPDPDAERKCVEWLSGEQEADPHRYKCRAKCVKRAKTAEEATACGQVCS